MTSEDWPNFKSLMQGVHALYRADITAATLLIWGEALKPYDFAAVKDALNRHAVDPDRGQFLPKPADVIRLLAGSTKDAAMLAWSKVVRASGSVGGYRTVVFDDPIIHAVLTDMGGWVALCEGKTEELPFRGNEFVTRYQGLRTRGGVTAWPAKLLGRTDLTNLAQGYRAQDPVLIGDASKAKKVLQLGGAEGLQVTTLGAHVAAVAHRLTGPTEKAA